MYQYHEGLSFFCSDLSHSLAFSAHMPPPHLTQPPSPLPPSTLPHFLCRRVRGPAVAPQVVQRGAPSSLSQTPFCRICPPRKGRWVLYGLLCVPCVCDLLL